VALTNRQIRQLRKIEEVELISKMIDHRHRHNSDATAMAKTAQKLKLRVRARAMIQNTMTKRLMPPMLWIKALNWLITGGKVTVISSDEKVSFDMHLIGFKYLVFNY
jgi:hypothetical protein